MPPRLPETDPGILANEVKELAVDAVARIPKIGHAVFDVLQRQFHHDEDILELPEHETNLRCHVLETKSTPSKHGDELREHRYVRMPIGESEHFGWFTKAADGMDTGITVIVQPGLGEKIDGELGEMTHEHLADMLPGADIFSHESSGMSDFNDDTSLGKLWSHGIDKMTLEGIELIRQLCPGRKIYLVGTSMGTIVNTRLMNLNTELGKQNPEGKPLDIIGAVHYDPALVDPSRILDFLRFPSELVVGAVKELLFKTNPRRLAAVIGTLIRSRPKPKHLVPMARQAWDITHGTPEEDIINSAVRYKIDVIAGSKGVVEQNTMWKRLSKLIPSLDYHVVDDRGHAMALNTFKAARKISKVIIKNQVHPPVYLPDAA